MTMRIRDRLLSSYLALIVLFSVGFTIIGGKIITGKISSQSRQASDNAIRKLADFNYKLSEELLTYYGKMVVEMEADLAASQIVRILAEEGFLDGKLDYEKLRAHKRLREIATQDIMAKNKVAGYVDVYDTSSYAVLHPISSVEGRYFSEWKDEFPEMWELVEKSLTEDKVSGLYTFLDLKTQEPKRKFMVVSTVPGTKLKVAAAVNIDDYFKPVHREIKEGEEKSIRMAEMDIEKSTALARKNVGLLSIIIVVFLSFFCLILAFFLSKSLSKPITRLQEGVEKIAKGEFSAKVEETGTVETIKLAQAVNSLGSELINRMEELKAEVSARQAVESELKIARQIQQSLIPRTFPAYPEHAEFDLRAALEPAKEVAGDFYDFYFINNTTLACMVGDVSGKGIPAALFMAVTRTLLKSICKETDDPAEALRKTNKVISMDNDSCMFVTLFLLYYDIITGQTTYANAGHHSSLHVKAGGDVEPFGLLGGVALGVSSNVDYQHATLTIKPGETIAVFTDGIFESVSPSEEAYGIARLVNILKQSSLGIDTICREVIDDVMKFEEGERFDDITMLALKRLL